MAAGLHAALEALSRRAGLPATPRLYHVPGPALNAFALGSRKAAAIAVTDGMLRSLNLRELAAVLAHEVGHIRNNDLWIMNSGRRDEPDGDLDVLCGHRAAGRKSAVDRRRMVTVPWMLVLLLLAAPLVMSLLQLALSRAREYDADLEAVRLIGEADGLAAALAKLERRQGRLWEGMLLPGRRASDPSLLRTHPPMAERIRRLEQPGAGAAAHAPRDLPCLVIAGPTHLAPIAAWPRQRWAGPWQ